MLGTTKVSGILWPFPFPLLQLETQLETSAFVTCGSCWGSPAECVPQTTLEELGGNGEGREEKHCAEVQGSRVDDWVVQVHHTGCECARLRSEEGVRGI